MQLVELIVTAPYDLDAVYYLLYERCEKVLKSVFGKVFYYEEDVDYREAIGELLFHLKECDWRRLKTYNGSAQFENWIWSVAAKVFRDYKKEFYDLDDGEENSYVRRFVCIDAIDEKGMRRFEERVSELRDNEDEDDKVNKMRIELLDDAVDELEDDYKFIVQRRKDGMRSREIAYRLSESWKSNGVEKYKQGKLVVPSEGYVNEMFKRAKEKLYQAMLAG